jgi:uncharacterized peroxidase-related enzyme
MMRLEIFQKQATLSAKVIAQIVRFVEGFSPDIVRVFLYRKEFFGEVFHPIFHEIMRADPSWTPGENELIAAFTSSKNRCRYCTDAHRATAAYLVGEGLAQAVIEDPAVAEISPKLRAMLAFVEKLTLAPRDVGPEDIAPLRAAGIDDAAIQNAVQVCVQFCMINRLADTFGFRPQSPKQLANEAKTLATKHYKF